MFITDRCGKKMARLGFLVALLFVGGLAMPAIEDDGAGFDEDMSIFFDHTETDIQGRIVGGTPAAAGAFPWMAAMTNGIARSFLCGASIFSQNGFLTAAHCLAAASTGSTISRNLQARVGTNSWNSGGQVLNAQSFRNHPQYNPRTIKNDIGVFWVSANIIFNNRVAPIAMDWSHIGPNVACRVSGWGRTSTGGPLAPNLMTLNTNTIDGARCNTEVQRIGNQLNMRPPPVDPAVEICTFLAANRGTCNGDSGSALVRNANNQQIGIVSWGLPCARGAPDMFVRVSAYRAWLGSL